MVQTATNYFRRGATVNQFRCFCLASTEIFSSKEFSEPSYSSIIFLKTNEDNDALDELPEDADAITDDDEDNLMCETNLNAENY